MPVVVHRYPLQAVLAHCLGYLEDFCGGSRTAGTSYQEASSSINKSPISTATISRNPTYSSRLFDMFVFHPTTLVVLSTLAGFGKLILFKKIGTSFGFSSVAFSLDCWNPILPQASRFISTDRRHDSPSSTTYVVQLNLVSSFSFFRSTLFFLFNNSFIATSQQRNQEPRIHHALFGSRKGKD